MGMVFVTGIPESGRDEIVEMVLTGSKKNLPEFDHFRFDDIASYEVDSSSGMVDLWSFSDRIGRMHSIQRDFNTRLRKKMDNLKLKGNHIIANGYFTFSTPGGYLPLLSRGSERFGRAEELRCCRR